MTTFLRTPRALVAGALLVASPLLGQTADGRRDTAAIALETRVRQRAAALVKARLALTDDQMRQLTAVNASFEAKRRELLARERESRVAIRGELRRGQGADESRVSAALDDLFKLQRERLDLVEQEQRQLAKFLRPSQRAQYAALQEQLRRRVDDMRRRREASPRSPAGPRPR
jgi:hypothetical protein